MKIIGHLLENPNHKDFYFLSLLHSSMRKKADDIRVGTCGMISPQAERENMNIILARYNGLEEHKANL